MTHIQRSEMAKIKSPARHAHSREIQTAIQGTKIGTPCFPWIDSSEHRMTTMSAMPTQQP